MPAPLVIAVIHHRAAYCGSENSSAQCLGARKLCVGPRHRSLINSCRRASAHEPHPFFEITAFSISLSRLRSATSFFKREFSSSNCRSRCASLTFIAPCSYSNPASLRFKAAMISASLNLFLGVVLLPSNRQNHI